VPCRAGYGVIADGDMADSTGRNPTRPTGRGPFVSCSTCARYSRGEYSCMELRQQRKWSACRTHARYHGSEAQRSAEPISGADVAGASPVPVQMWQG
jgi:hypothetical protein